MESIGTVLIVLVAFIAGAMLSYFLLRSGIFGHARIVELEQALAASEAELADYKQRVTNEFTDTAEKFRSLNRSYEELHRQLAKSANALCGEAGAPMLLEPRTDVLEPAPAETPVHDVDGTLAADQDIATAPADATAATPDPAAASAPQENVEDTEPSQNKRLNPDP
ncbi:MAG: DUF1043 family protein [Pseudomonadota bacterium]|nr:DUF1043 family protein [Pseudomonadota bacterium]